MSVDRFWNIFEATRYKFIGIEIKMARRRHRVDLSGGRLEHASDDQAFSTENKVHFLPL